MIGAIETTPSQIFTSIRCNLSIDAAGCVYSWAYAVGEAFLITLPIAAVAWVLLSPAFRSLRSSGVLTESVPHYRSISARITHHVSGGAALRGFRTSQRGIAYAWLSVALVFFGVNAWTAAMGMTQYRAPFFYGGPALVVLGAVSWLWRRMALALAGRRTGIVHVAYSAVVSVAWMITIGIVRGEALNPPSGFAPGPVGLAPLSFIAAAAVAVWVSRRENTLRDSFVEAERSRAEDEPFAQTLRDEHGNLALAVRDKDPGVYTGFVGAPFWPEGLRPVFEPASTVVIGPPRSRASTRVLGPATVMRNGPTVVVSSDVHLARIVAPIVEAQGTRSLWWDPTDSFVPPGACRPVRWDVLSTAATADAALHAAGILARSVRQCDSTARIVGGALPASGGPPGKVADGEDGVADPALTLARDVAAAIMLASRFTGRSSARCGHWIKAGPGSWQEAIGILDSSADVSAHELARRLESSAATLDGDWNNEANEILTGVAMTLSMCDDTGIVDGDPFHVPLFLRSLADVLFVLVPPGEASVLSGAATLLIDVMVAHHREDRYRRGPLTVVLDEIHTTFSIGDLAAFLSGIESGGTIVLASVSRASELHARWGVRGTSDALSAVRSRLVLDATAPDDLRGLLIPGETLHRVGDPAGGARGEWQSLRRDHYEIDAGIDGLADLVEGLSDGSGLPIVDGAVRGSHRLPGFDEPPWSEVATAARMGAGHAVPH